MFKRLTVLGATCLTAVAVAVPLARAQTTVAFLCYSTFQVDPGVFPLGYPIVTPRPTAADDLAAGYWSPYAETSVPTNTKIGNYYLDCMLPTGLSVVAGETVTQKGVEEATNPWYLTHPGYFPLAATSG